MNAKFDRITINPEILNGQPCMRGMRLTSRSSVQSGSGDGVIGAFVKALVGAVLVLLNVNAIRRGKP